MGDLVPVRDVRADFEAALRDYIADLTDGAILTDYIIVSAATNLEDFGTSRTVYCTVEPPQQPPHVSMGLLGQAMYGNDDD